MLWALSSLSPSPHLYRHLDTKATAEYSVEDHHTIVFGVITMNADGNEWTRINAAHFDAACYCYYFYCQYLKTDNTILLWLFILIHISIVCCASFIVLGQYTLIVWIYMYIVTIEANRIDDNILLVHHSFLDANRSPNYFELKIEQQLLDWKMPFHSVQHLSFILIHVQCTVYVPNSSQSCCCHSFLLLIRLNWCNRWACIQMRIFEFYPMDFTHTPSPTFRSQTVRYLIASWDKIENDANEIYEYKTGIMEMMGIYGKRNDKSSMKYHISVKGFDFEIINFRLCKGNETNKRKRRKCFTKTISISF